MLRLPYSIYSYIVEYMGKYSFVRNYYPFALLVIGIVALYYFINTTEGFSASKPISIYLNSGTNNMISFADSTDKGIVDLNKSTAASTNKSDAASIALKLPNYMITKFRLSVYGKNCSNKVVKVNGVKQLQYPENVPDKKTGACWYEIDNINSITMIGTDNNNKTHTFDASSMSTKSFKMLKITGLSSIGIDINNILTTTTNYGIKTPPSTALKNATNIRIDLTATPGPSPAAPAAKK